MPLGFLAPTRPDGLVNSYRYGNLLLAADGAAPLRLSGPATANTCSTPTRSRAATRGSVRGKVGPNAAQPNTAVEAAACGDGDTGDAGTAYGFAKPALAA